MIKKSVEGLFHKDYDGLPLIRISHLSGLEIIVQTSLDNMGFVLLIPISLKIDSFKYKSKTYIEFEFHRLDTADQSVIFSRTAGTCHCSASTRPVHIGH